MIIRSQQSTKARKKMESFTKKTDIQKENQTIQMHFQQLNSQVYQAFQPNGTSSF